MMCCDDFEELYLFGYCTKNNILTINITLRLKPHWNRQVNRSDFDWKDYV